MTNFVYANNVSTTITNALTPSDTSLTVASTTNLPTLADGQVMALTLNDAATHLIFEVCYVTAISGNTLTVERAQEGTSSQSWAVGDIAYAAVTAAELQALQTASANVRSFNTRTGAVTLEASDVDDAMGYTPANPADLVTSFNGRQGVVTLTLADIESAGGAPVESPDLTGTPTAPTAAAGTDTTQIATTAFARQQRGCGNIIISSLNGPMPGTLVCNGALVSRTTYADLFAVIGTTWGAGDGSTTFAIPNIPAGDFIRMPGGNAAAWNVAQGDTIRNISGSVGNVVFNSISNTATSPLYAIESFDSSDAGSPGRQGSALYFDASRNVPTDVENRPVNISLYYCIIY